MVGMNKYHTECFLMNVLSKIKCELLWFIVKSLSFSVNT